MSEEMSEVLRVNLRLAELETGIFSPRRVFSQGHIDELAESIEREGQLKPIIVQLHPMKPNVYRGGHTRRVVAEETSLF